MDFLDYHSHLFCQGLRNVVAVVSFVLPQRDALASALAGKSTRWREKRGAI